MFKDLRPEAVREAAQRIASHVVRTPLIKSAPLSRLAGGDVYLKLENRQITGSFKLRGALNALATLVLDSRRGVVASSAGNHGLGVAYAAKVLGVPAKIFVPSTAPDVKKSGIRALGAMLDDTQPDYDAAMTAAKAYGEEHGLAFINPCLGDMLLAGQGTVALEILDQLPDLRTLVVCVGGGGLLGGCASLVRHDAPSVRIIGAQSDQTAAMARSIAAGHVVEIPVTPTLADGLAGQIDEEALDIGRHALDDIVLLTEVEIARAIAWLHREHDIKVEGAGAVAAGAVLFGKTPLTFPASVIVSGGNVDEVRWRAVLAGAA
ncbi:MAG TPA: pyridoxal-phosphate dependent enzyme [Gemmatimonadaceae bacterium]|nr:pyridoxal-phosphate dependent enzyme [Gemmatimonadaceae bacterium]